MVPLSKYHTMIRIVERGNYLPTVDTKTSNNATHNHNTHRTVLKKNTDTMISRARRLPAASILQVSAIAVRHAIDLDHRNTAKQFFYMKLSVSLFYWLLFCMPLTGTHGDKRYVFLVNTSLVPFFWPLRRINAHWPQLSADMFFADATWVLVMFWHDFGRGGGSAIVVMVVVGGAEAHGKVW